MCQVEGESGVLSIKEQESLGGKLENGDPNRRGGGVLLVENTIQYKGVSQMREEETPGVSAGDGGTKTNTKDEYLKKKAEPDDQGETIQTSKGDGPKGGGCRREELRGHEEVLKEKDYISQKNQNAEIGNGVGGPAEAGLIRGRRKRGTGGRVTGLRL